MKKKQADVQKVTDEVKSDKDPLVETLSNMKFDEVVEFRNNEDYSKLRKLTNELSDNNVVLTCINVRSTSGQHIGINVYKKNIRNIQH